MSGRFLKDAERRDEPRRPRGASSRVLSGGPALALKALFWCLAVLLPVTASWIASSMAAYANGPVWLVALTAFALFPILPLAFARVHNITTRHCGWRTGGWPEVREGGSARL